MGVGARPIHKSNLILSTIFQWRPMFLDKKRFYIQKFLKRIKNAPPFHLYPKFNSHNLKNVFYHFITPYRLRIIFFYQNFYFLYHKHCFDHHLLTSHLCHIKWLLYLIQICLSFHFKHTKN